MSVYFMSFSRHANLPFPSLTVISVQWFVGATDSAAPCAIMLDIAETLDPLLDDT
jgi:hypothetical protein